MKSYQVQAFGHPLVATEGAVPTPQGTEVLVRVHACGVCHSDLHLADGYYDLGDNKKMDLSRGVPLPLTLGHEIVGEVVASGPDAGMVDTGARRVIYPWIGCSTCPVCQRGDEHLCAHQRALGVSRPGGFAEYVLVPHPRYLIDLGSIPEAQACTYACSGLTAFGALKKLLPIAPDDHILMIGAGGVGLSGVRLAKSFFGHAPIVAETDEGKWAAARDAGASSIIDPRASGSARELRNASGGGVSAVIDFVGSAASFEFALECLGRGGKLIVVGLYGGKASIVPAVAFPVRGLTIVGSTMGSLADMNELMAFARQNTMPALPVSVRPMDTANAALDDLRAGKVVGRAVLQP